MRRAELPINDPPNLRPGYFFRVKREGVFYPMVTVEIRRGQPGKRFTTKVSEKNAVLEHDSDVPRLITGLAWKAAVELDHNLDSWDRFDEVAPYEGDHGG